jgi:hypothetical protein
MSKKRNVFEECDGYITGWTTNTNRPFYFDYDDWEIVKNRSWYEDHAENGYVVTSGGSGNKPIYLHKLIMGDKGIVDHKNRNKLDNRKNNLRIVTHQENMCNKNISIRNKSGKQGVTWHKRAKAWEAKIQFKGKNYGVKYFKSLEEAIKYRESLEDIYFKNLLIKKGANPCK